MYMCTRLEEALGGATGNGKEQTNVSFERVIWLYELCNESLLEYRGCSVEVIMDSGYIP